MLLLSLSLNAQQLPCLHLFPVQLALLNSPVALYSFISSANPCIVLGLARAFVLFACVTVDGNAGMCLP